MAARSGGLSAWRHGDNPTDWPSLWDRAAEKWPTVAPALWTPPCPGAAAVACLAEPPEVLRWADLSEAVDAAELYAVPCRPCCEGTHVLLWADEHRAHVARIGPPPSVPTLDAELRELYPRKLNGHTLYNTPALWPAPSDLNPKIARKPVGVLTPQ